MPRDKPADRFPDDVVAYRRTPEFDAATTPPGLLGEHNTKAGVWGRIHVMEGALLYRVTDPRREATERLLKLLAVPDRSEVSFAREEVWFILIKRQTNAAGGDSKQTYPRRAGLEGVDLFLPLVRGLCTP